MKIPSHRSGVTSHAKIVHGTYDTLRHVCVKEFIIFPAFVLKWRNACLSIHLLVCLFVYKEGRTGALRWKILRSHFHKERSIAFEVCLFVLFGQ